MLAVAHLTTLSLSLPAKPVVAGKQFHRATDLLSSEPSASAVDVVNVLGRWSTYAQWERIGELVQMDKLFDADAEFKVKPKAQQSSGLLAPKKGNGDWVMKTPERRRFCLRQGLVQRYWFSQNVGQLPFKSKALAASVGCSVAELNKRSLDPLAIDVVFDALARSKAGIVVRETCDQRRASYEAEDGSFDAATFVADLSGGRLKYLGSVLIFPGGPFILQSLIWYKLDGPAQALAYLADAQMKLMGFTLL
mmetsp:Transcript_31464/g.74301  ORF Transcript_31464/g.74301 Transcript_31464/m.74301 type:complete len:250 (-) Transcript_31464:324-1073(-)